MMAEVADEASAEEDTDVAEATDEPAVDEAALAALEEERAEGLQRLAQEREAERQAALAAEEAERAEDVERLARETKAELEAAAAAADEEAAKDLELLAEEREATLAAAAAKEEQAARERIAGLRRLADERAAERRAAAATNPVQLPAVAEKPADEPKPLAPVAAEAAAAPAPVAVIPDEQIETLRREIVENVASIVENVSDNVREGVTSDVLAQTEEVIDTRFAETQAQVAQTQAQLQQTEQAIGSQLSQTQAALQQTDRRLAAIQQSLSEQQQATQAQQQAAQAQISQLDNRIEQLQIRDVAVAQRGALLIAITELGDRFDAGQPFRRQLNAVEAITGGQTELTELRSFADSGLPSDDAMRLSFEEAARNALAGAKRDSAEGGFGQFMANLSGLFTIRPVGDVEGDTVGAIIARAEQRLEGGDMGAATRELSQLEGSAETAFADWVAAAEAKATADRGLRALEQQVTAPRRG